MLSPCYMYAQTCCCFEHLGSLWLLSRLAGWLRLCGQIEQHHTDQQVPPDELAVNKDLLCSTVLTANPPFLEVVAILCQGCSTPWHLQNVRGKEAGTRCQQGEAGRDGLRPRVCLYQQCGALVLLDVKTGGYALNEHREGPKVDLRANAILTARAVPALTWQDGI